jgi:hypothetical protein
MSDVSRLVEQARELIEAAEQHVYALCRGDEQWTMRAATTSSKDSDLVIANGLRAGRELADAVEQLQQEARINDVVCHDLISKAADFIAERDEARARVAELEAAARKATVCSRRPSRERQDFGPCGICGSCELRALLDGGDR